MGINIYVITADRPVLSTDAIAAATQDPLWYNLNTGLPAAFPDRSGAVIADIRGRADLRRLIPGSAVVLTPALLDTIKRKRLPWLTAEKRAMAAAMETGRVVSLVVCE